MTLVVPHSGLRLVTSAQTPTNQRRRLAPDFAEGEYARQGASEVRPETRRPNAGRSKRAGRTRPTTATASGQALETLEGGYPGIPLLRQP